MKRNLKYSLFFVLISLFAYIFSLPYMSAVMNALFETGKLDDLGINVKQLLMGSAVNFAIYSFVFSLIGVSLAHKVGLRWEWIKAVFDRNERPSLDGRAIRFSIVSSIIVSILIIGLQFLFISYMPEYKEVAEQIKPNLAWWIGLTSIFQGGIVEEVMMRLGFMTLLVWVLSKLFGKNKKMISNWIYVFAILIAAVVFGVGHLGIAELLVGTLTLPIIVFVILGNSIGGILFGYLYWKKGLEYAMIAHMTGDVMLHFVFPLVERLF